MTDIVYSIIIPHKDIPELLNRCLSSIPFRDDIQIIVVDDNSVNPICVEKLPHNGYKNFLFIQDYEQKGAGHVRNIGMKYALGRWLLFIDADDFYSKDAFSLFDQYSDSNYDIVHFNQEGCYSDNIKEYSNRCEMFSRVIREYCLNPNEDNEDKLRYSMHTPYVKMIKREMVVNNNILFDESIGSNDVMFSAKIGYSARKVFAVDKIAYYVTVRRGSLTKIISRENFYSRYCVWIRYNIFMDAIGKKCMKVDLTPWMFKSLFYFGWKEFVLYCKTLQANHIGPNIKLASYFKYFISLLKKIIIIDAYQIRSNK